MPVIIYLADYPRWLKSAEPPADLLRPYPADEMTAYPASTNVNKAGCEDPDIIEPL